MEFISWMLFRGIADIILTCDFISFILFAASYFEFPEKDDSIFWTDLLRYFAGGVLLFIHLSVKFYGKKTVKDFAGCM
jgi:phosphatidylethanolamine N-methyltransferase